MNRRAGIRHFDRSELLLELGHVVLHRQHQPLHVLGVGDDAREHLRAGLLRLHVDEVERELGLGVVHQRHVDVLAVGHVVIELDLQLDFGRLAGVSIDAIVSTGDQTFRENILFTHRGLSGPAILQISNYSISQSYNQLKSFKQTLCC